MMIVDNGGCMMINMFVMKFVLFKALLKVLKLLAFPTIYCVFVLKYVMIVY